LPQFLQFIQAVGGTGLITIDYGSGSPQEAAAELAYLEGSPTDNTQIGVGLEWSDSASAWESVNWGTVGYWASLRAASPLGTDDGLNFLRIDHPAPFTDIKYSEIGNEEYGNSEVDHHGTAGPGGVSTGLQHNPATYAAFAEWYAGMAAEILSTAHDPWIPIGIDSQDPTGDEDNNWTENVLADGLADGFVPGFISDHSYAQQPGVESDAVLLNGTVTKTNSILDWSTRYAEYESLLETTLGAQAANVQVMATEFNSVQYDPGKQSTSLINGLFVAESIGSLLDSGYAGGYLWDLRDGWTTVLGNTSEALYGWRLAGDYGMLGSATVNQPPETGAYVPYPDYFAEQLAAKIDQAGGQVVAATSNYQDFNTYAVLEPNGDLDLLVVNTNPVASLTEQINLSGFQPDGSATFWQYGEAQDTAQSESTTGSSALASWSTTSLSGASFTYSFSAYSMTVIQIAP
jgi:alpha-L-arabinofuranosidase